MVDRAGLLMYPVTRSICASINVKKGVPALMSIPASISLTSVVVKKYNSLITFEFLKSLIEILEQTHLFSSHTRYQYMRLTGAF